MNLKILKESFFMKNFVLFVFSICFIFMSSLASAETKKSASSKKIVSRVKNAYPVYCGVLARGVNSANSKKMITLVDETTNPKAKFFNVQILEDVEVSLEFSPSPGDSDPKSESYKDHSVMIGKEKVWMQYPSDLFTDSDLKNRDCVCASGEVENRNGKKVMTFIQGIISRDSSHCKDISTEAVNRFL